MKKLEVPYNLDPDIFFVYDNWKEYIKEVYFPTSPDLFPSARQFKNWPLDYNATILRLCKYCYKNNIDSMLLLNGTNIPLTNDKLSEISKYLKQLVECHLTGVVIANPLLAHYVHKQYPQLKIRLSVISYIDNLEKIKQIEQLGYITQICLPTSLVRNKDELKRIRENTNLELSIIVNTGCRANCPLWGWHHSAYNSNTNLNSKDFSEIKESIYTETRSFVYNNFASPWILPEDLYQLDAYIDVYKLEDRQMSIQTLEKVIKSYALRQNPDYLSDCLNGSCIHRDDIETKLIPYDWRVYTQNCKNQCWNCDKCDKLAAQLKKEENGTC